MTNGIEPKPTTNLFFRYVGERYQANYLPSFLIKTVGGLTVQSGYNFAFFEVIQWTVAPTICSGQNQCGISLGDNWWLIEGIQRMQ